MAAGGKNDREMTGDTMGVGGRQYCSDASGADMHTLLYFTTLFPLLEEEILKLHVGLFWR